MRKAFLVIRAGLVFSIQRLLQLFLGLVVEFVVFARGLASLLPELISPPDNIHFLGCGHASSLKRSPAFGVWGPRAETALLPAPFWCTTRVESAHFDWRWRERPALALLAWEALVAIR